MKFPALIAALLVSTACSAGDTENANAQNAAAPAQNGAAQAGLPFAIAPVADLTSPWALTFLPDGRLLVTEKAGQLKLVSADGRQVTDVSGVPSVDSAGQGALKDIRLAPTFAQDNRVYFSFSEAVEGGKTAALARARLELGDDGQAALRDVQVIFRGTPIDGNGHYSARIAFAPDGQHLFFAHGDRQKLTPAQERDSTIGKILRLTMDGQPAPGNPLAQQGFHPAIWSYGHRNVLGMSFDAAGNLWAQEMGPENGDELNVILPGRNYGWPVVSDGDHYDGRPIPDHSTRPEFEAPRVSWVPAISPGGLMIYRGSMFPEWRGDAFIGGLSAQALVRVDIDGTNASKGDQWSMGQRIRDVAEGPDGAIWVIEDGQRGGTGRLLRLSRPN